MFRIFVIIISSLAFCAAQAADLPNLDQINADLLAKKAQNEPFKDKDVKIDLESLGLDEIDAKDAKAKADKNPPAPPAPEPAKTDNVLKSSDLPDIKKTGLAKTTLIAPDNKTAEEAKPAAAPATIADKMKAMQKNITKSLDDKGESKAAESGGTLSKIQHFIHKTDKKNSEEKVKKDDVKKIPEVVETPSAVAVESIAENPAPDSPNKIEADAKAAAAKEKKKEAYINAQKKANLKKQLEAKKAAKKKAEENEKKRKIKLAKLNQLREKYLIKINSDKSTQDNNIDEDLSDADTKIIPQKKDINKFVSYETPAPPIMDRYRNRDNEGIPIVISDSEKADILFRSIGQEDISFFNSAYNSVENPNLRNNVGDTILTYAILLQKREVVASILAKGADPNLLNGLGYTPLQITIESLDLGSFNLLVNHNADINYIDGFGRTYLMHAARLGFLPAIEILLKKGADINALDYDGFSALSIASKYKQDLAVTLLLKNGAKPWVEKVYDPESESLIKQLENRWKK